MRFHFVRIITVLGVAALLLVSLPSGDAGGTDRITQSLPFSANGVSTNGASCCGGSVSEEWSYIYDYDGIEEYFYDMEVDEDGNVYVGGTTYIEGQRFLLLKLNSAGGMEWVDYPNVKTPGRAVALIAHAT